MRIETTDPMTGNDVSKTDDAPFVIEGSGSNALKIYFESEISRQEYLAIEMKAPDAKILQRYDQTIDTAMEM